MSEYGFGAVPNELLDRKDTRIAELEAALTKSDQKCADLWADVSLYQNRLADVATEREQAEEERDQANTSAIAQRRSFEKALEGRDEIIAELEAENGRMDDALHSAFDDYRVDFPDSRIDDYDKWLALHVTCGSEMRPW